MNLRGLVGCGCDEETKNIRRSIARFTDVDALEITTARILFEDDILIARW